MNDAILVLEGVNASYGKSHVLHGVSLQVGAGEVVSVLGRNGMGKTTTLRTIVGLLRAHAGSVRFEGDDLASVAVDDIARRGVSLVPAHRGIFTLLSVQENLQIAQRRHAAWTLERIYEEFPRLRERLRNLGGALSGGEQQMLAIARALVQGPRLLLLDEPTEGLAPVIVDELTELIRGVGESGIAIVLVEQSFAVCRALAQRHYILEEGMVVFEGSTGDLDADTSVLERFLGLDVDAH
ncbi:High-affinity branched-chain amino acid transport ATP-binding protein LivF [compost metagenome]